MASTTVAPLAFAARVAGTRLDSRRRCVVRSRVPAKSRLVSESAMKVDDSLNEDAPEGTTKSPVVLAAAAVATAIVLAASPARGAEARPSVDVGAHDYYLETLQASGVRPASIEVRSAPATGLKRFGSAATAADETASLVSTAFAVGLAAALGLSGTNKKGPKPGSSKSNNAATAKKSNIVKNTSKPFNRKTTGTAYVPSYRGDTASSSSSSRGGSGASRDSGSGPAPAMQAAAALGATVVLGGLAGAGPAVLEAEGAAVAAAATSAVLLGTAASAAVSTQTKKKADVRSNIITFKTAVAPAPKTRTKIINRTTAPTRVKAPPAKPPFGGAGNAKAKPRRSPGDAGDSATSQSAAVLAVVGLGALLLAGSAANPDQATKTKTAKSDAKSFASKSKFSATFKAPTFEAPAVDLPAIPAMDWNKNVFAELEMPELKVPEMKVSLPEMKIALPEVSDGKNAVAPLVGATLLLASVATLAGVGLERRGSRAYDPAAAAKSVAEAQVWIDTWQRSILYPENPEHVFSAAWDRNAPTLERVAEASTYAAEAEQARRPRPYSRADVERRAGDAQAWIDAWALGLLAESVAKKNKRSDEALHDWETGRIIGAWNKGLAESAEAPRAAAETRSAVAARVKQAQTWINAWQKSLKASATLAKSKKALEVKKAVKAKKGATKTKKGQGEKSSRRAYYETVAGVKYDKAVLEACRGFVANSGALDLSSAKTTWALIADGAVKKQVRTDGRVVKSAVTNVELATATYVLEAFEWADDAAAWFRERIEAVDKK